MFMLFTRVSVLHPSFIVQPNLLKKATSQAKTKQQWAKMSGTGFCKKYFLKDRVCFSLKNGSSFKLHSIKLFCFSEQKVSIQKD